MSHSSLYESVFYCGPDGNCLLSPTPEAIILDVNDALLRFVGRRREELVGISLFKVFPGDPDDPDNTVVASARASIVRAIETRSAQVVGAHRYPIPVTLPGGDTGFEERYWSAVNTPVFDGAGNIVCISHTTRDVTDHHLFETTLRQSEGRLRAFITAASDVVYRMSPDWKYMYQLDGRGFLKTTTAWAEYRIEQYVHPIDLERARDAIATAIRDKTIFELEHRVLRSDDSPGWTYSKAVPMLDPDGEIYEWIGTASDITQRKLTEEKLKDADRRKDEFLAMLAHELRNPLAPISSAAHLLASASLDTARVRRTSDIIVRQVRHMTSLVDDLLDVSRVTRGIVAIEHAPVDIGAVVADAVEQATPLIRARAHHLTQQLTLEGASIVGDQKRLVQVVTNLLNNAAKYTREGGNIVLRSTVQDGDVIIEVSDDGIGVDSRIKDHVFELFAQAEVTPARSAGGLGLGLALVKSIVELHGGVVGCHSSGTGQGSTFSVRLPRASLPVAAAAEPPAMAAPQQQRGHLRLLVVDDNVDAAAMLGMLLDAAGHEVQVEHEPYQALARAQVDVPDACLLDIGLPGMDGNELARRLRERPATAGAVLIAVTGYGQEHDRQASLAAGFDHYLVKPVDTAGLMALLAQVNHQRGQAHAG